MYNISHMYLNIKVCGIETIQLKEHENSQRGI